MRLNEIQSRFRDIMLDHPDALKATPPEFSGLFAAGEIALPERLKVYRNNIVGSVTEALIATFPLIEKITGRGFLEGMARSFALSRPPEQGCLNMYGAGFDEFIAGFEPARSLPYLPDVARLEIAMNEAYYAPDDRALSAAELAAVTLQSSLKPRASLQLVASRYPLAKIRDFTLTDAAENTGTLDVTQGGAWLMVHRPALAVEVHVLDEAEYEMLRQLQNGETLGAAMKFVLTQSLDFDFQAFLARHLERGSFTPLHTE